MRRLTPTPGPPQLPMRLVYVSPVPLTSFAQRPHHFVEWFHQRFGAPVLWIDPGPSRLPRLSDLPRLFQIANPALGPEWRNAEWVQSVRCRVLPVEPYAWGRAINRVLWQPVLDAVDQFVTDDTWLVLAKPCALSVELARRHDRLPLVFDAMDHVPGFCQGVSKQWMLRAEAEMAERSRWIMTSSSALARYHAGHGGKVRTVLNGLTLPPAAAAGGAANDGRQRVLGFVGAIDSWFDWGAITRLALAQPDLELRLIGPVRRAPPGALPANVRLLPAIAQHQVYAALQQFSVGLIPFRLDDVTAYADPVKYYEYRAVGLPVLSTRFGQMAQRHRSDGVFFFEDLTDGTLSLQQIMASRLEAYETAGYCAANSWQQRFNAVDFFQDAPGSALDQTPGSTQ